MSLKAVELPITNDLAKRQLQGEVFAALYRSIMELVEETASYLDVPGREASKKMDRSTAMDYSVLSQRLTASAMRVAGMALILRAIRDGKLPLNSGLADIAKKGMTAPPPEFSGSLSGQPSKIIELGNRCDALRVDTIRLIESLTNVGQSTGNPVHAAINRLHKSFVH